MVTSFGLFSLDSEFHEQKQSRCHPCACPFKAGGRVAGRASLQPFYWSLVECKFVFPLDQEAFFFWIIRRVRSQMFNEDFKTTTLGQNHSSSEFLWFQCLPKASNDHLHNGFLVT